MRVRARCRIENDNSSLNGMTGTVFAVFTAPREGSDGRKYNVGMTVVKLDDVDDESPESMVVVELDVLQPIEKD